MQRCRNHAFAERSLVDDSLKLAMARDLQRQFSAGLTEPLPPDLQRLIALLDSMSRSALRGRSREPGCDHHVRSALGHVGGADARSRSRNQPGREARNGSEAMTTRS